MNDTMDLVIPGFCGMGMHLRLCLLYTSLPECIWFSENRAFFYGKGVPQDYAGSPDLLLSGKELFVLYGRQWSGKPYSAGNTGRYFKQRPDPSPEHLRGPGCGLHHVCVLYPVPERRYVG